MLKNMAHFIHFSFLSEQLAFLISYEIFFISNFIFWSVLELLIFAQNFSTGVLSQLLNFLNSQILKLGPHTPLNHETIGCIHPSR